MKDPLIYLIPCLIYYYYNGAYLACTALGSLALSMCVHATERCVAHRPYINAIVHVVLYTQQFIDYHTRWGGGECNEPWVKLKQRLPLLRAPGQIKRMSHGGPRRRGPGITLRSQRRIDIVYQITLNKLMCIYVYIYLKLRERQNFHVLWSLV